jgi:micrococcal nuclease
VEEPQALEPDTAPYFVKEVEVLRVIDGDTIETDRGTIRIIGYDTPEKGQCGYEEATDRAKTVIDDAAYVYIRKDGIDVEDTDKYGRFLRHVFVSDTPISEIHPEQFIGEFGTYLGDDLIEEGLATPRYNSTDGYGEHDMESTYAQTWDNVDAVFECSDYAELGDEKVKAPVQDKSNTSVYYQNCTAARAAGAAPVYAGEPGYGSHLDRDGDGVGCDS